MPGCTHPPACYLVSISLAACICLDLGQINKRTQSYQSTCITCSASWCPCIPVHLHECYTYAMHVFFCFDLTATPIMRRPTQAQTERCSVRSRVKAIDFYIHLTATNEGGKPTNEEWALNGRFRGAFSHAIYGSDSCMQYTVVLAMIMTSHKSSSEHFIEMAPLLGCITEFVRTTWQCCSSLDNNAFSTALCFRQVLLIHWQRA